jgi:hypothetical protein
MFDADPNLPDDTLIEMVRLSPLIRKSLNAAGLKTIGEIRAMPDDKLRTKRASEQVHLPICAGRSALR